MLSTRLYYCFENTCIHLQADSRVRARTLAPYIRPQSKHKQVRQVWYLEFDTPGFYRTYWLCLLKFVFLRECYNLTLWFLIVCCNNVLYWASLLFYFSISRFKIHVLQFQWDIISQFVGHNSRYRIKHIFASS